MADNVSDSITRLAREHGLIIYPRRSLMGEKGDHTLISPPLITTRVQCDEIFDLLAATFDAFQAQRSRT